LRDKRQTDKQTRLKDEQADRQTCGQIERWIVGQTDRQTDKWTRSSAYNINKILSINQLNERILSCFCLFVYYLSICPSICPSCLSIWMRRLRDKRQTDKWARLKDEQADRQTSGQIEGWTIVQTDRQTMISIKC
jgi:hypothetical protein